MKLNRREFLTTTVAAAAVPVLPLSALPGDSGPIKLSVATYSLRKFKRPEAVKMIQQLQIRFADVKDFHLALTDSPDQLKEGIKEFHDAGIKVIAAGNIDLKKPAELRPAFEYAKTCGIPTIVCAPAKETLPDIEKLVKEFNIKIAIHNHGPEDKIFPTPQSVLDAVKDMDQRMGLCIDIGHTARTGADIVESIRLAGPRLHEMHMKDLKDPHNADWKVARDSQVPVGEGVLPIADIFRQLIKQKYPGYCSLEYEIHETDPLPGMQQSFAYMRKVITEIHA
jgi:sugar phosphate isomerase/epimerase